MTRSVSEWVGRTDDTPVPPRVKLRLFVAAGGKCADCGLKIIGANGPPQADHVQSIINGGSNSERNLQILCKPCHDAKTRKDVAEKSIVARKAMKNLGIGGARKKIQSRGFPKASPQHSASRPLRERT